MKLAWRILGGMLSAALLLVVAGSAYLAFSARRSADAIPSILGFKVMAVLSGSMEPAIRTGDVIMVEPMGIGEVAAEGDVITYRTREQPDVLITHRVVGHMRVNGEPFAYVTKGDNNPSEDLSTVPLDHVVGRYRYRVPLYGYFATFMRKPAGILLFVILPGLVLIGLEFRKIWQLILESEQPKAQGGGELDQQ